MRPRGIQPERSGDDLRRFVARGVSLPHELLLAEPQQLDAAVKRSSQRRSCEVGDHELVVGAQIGDQSAVYSGVDDVRRLAAGDHSHVGVQAGAERDPVQLVRRVALKRAGVHAHDFRSGVAPSIVDVHAVGGAAGRRPELDRLGLDQTPEHTARLAAQRAAQAHFRAQRRREPRDPEALTTGMQMNLRAVGSRLDGDREERRRREHRDPTRGWRRVALGASGVTLEARRQGKSHMASATIRRIGSTSDGTAAIV
jgi:hypothetical protein